MKLPGVLFVRAVKIINMPVLSKLNTKRRQLPCKKETSFPSKHRRSNSASSYLVKPICTFPNSNYMG